jgi:hypothetical protein
MAQYPVEVGDSEAIAEGLNYLLSGPSGLGQNFEGFSAYEPVYIRPSGRQPWSLPLDTTLDPSVYLALPITNIVIDGGNPSSFLTVTFTAAYTDPPFQFGDKLDILGVVETGTDETLNATGFVVYSCTASTVTVGYNGEFLPFVWNTYVSGGTIGRNYLDGTAMAVTECNARVTVAGATDQVFVSAQVDLAWEYDCVTATDYEVVIAITRLRGFPTGTPGSNDYLFADTVVVSEKPFARSVAPGTGTQSLEAVFTTVLDGPNLNFGYYWYILTVEFVMPGGITVEVGSEKFTLGGTIAAQGSTTTYSGISPTTTTGNGTGLVVDIELQANAGGDDYDYDNTTIDVVTSGSGYLVGDIITIPGTSLGGATPADDMELVIDTVGPPFDTTIGRATTALRSLTAQVIKQ